MTNDKLKDFALEIARRLRNAGFQAYFAGGCVRDMLLGTEPKDYDIATNATPDQVCDLFGKRRTLTVGKAFGVVAIIGPKHQRPIEVATFRKEAGYSDGRHPDQVSFTDAKEDALRRDFTINGMFYDPLTDEVIDYVGGQEDLGRRVVRCIGDPNERFSEDRLRMLRAVRFAATLDFEIDPATMEAIQQHAAAIVQVSAERIANELRRMLVVPAACRALQLLEESQLRDFVFPEFRDRPEEWQQASKLVGYLQTASFELTCAALFYPIWAEKKHCIDDFADRLKLSNRERELPRALLGDNQLVREGHLVPWPRLQRILVSPHAELLVEFAEAVCKCFDHSMEGIEYCRKKLQLPREQLDPEPLLTGSDLIRIGLRPGPSFRQILDAVRDKQLNGEVLTKEEAIREAIKLAEQLTRETQ